MIFQKFHAFILKSYKNGIIFNGKNIFETKMFSGCKYSQALILKSHEN